MRKLCNSGKVEYVMVKMTKETKEKFEAARELGNYSSVSEMIRKVISDYADKLEGGANGK